MLKNGVFVVNDPVLWIDLVLSILILGACFYVAFRVFKRKVPLISLGVSALVAIIAWVFGLSLLHGIALCSCVVLSVIYTIVNQASIRSYASNALKGASHKKATEKVFDRHELYSKVAVAVEALSKNKTGAIITFERNVKLNDVIKSGTLINAPVTPELLMTIFYPGTRLHDGAVVIRRDEILAASVYYTPTTKPLTGKFGSRHRAAIGISEVTDSVTIVVSEETGRISLAVDGELLHCSVDTFLRQFEDSMLQESTNPEIVQDN